MRTREVIIKIIMITVTVILKDGRNDRLVKKKTLIRTRNWWDSKTKKIFYWKLQGLHRKQLKTTAGWKKFKIFRIYDTRYDRWTRITRIDERYWSSLWWVMLRNVSNT